MEYVVLVDAEDRELGIEEKIQAHLSGKLHRAVSVFLFSEKGELLIQQRAEGKYHSAGLWSNSCCSHPRPGELPLQAAERRLWEEMGVHCPLEKAFQFTYRALLGEGMIENELDHVFTGRFQGEVRPDPSEISAWRWISREEVLQEIAAFPETYTVWFKILLPEVLRNGSVLGV